MKKSGMKLFTFMLTAGMLAIAATAGAATSRIATTETVEFKVEENDSALITNNGKMGALKDKRYLSDVEKSLSKGYGFTRVQLNEGNRTVLLVAPRESIFSNLSKQVYAYVEIPGQGVRCIGTLKNDWGISIKDGVLYTCTDDLVESFVVSSDGKRLVRKNNENVKNWNEPSRFVKAYMDSQEITFRIKG